MEEQAKVYQLGLISVEIFKKENKVRYQMTVPWGSDWQDAINVCDEFKVALTNMQKLAAEQEQASKDQAVAEPLIS